MGRRSPHPRRQGRACARRLYIPTAAAQGAFARGASDAAAAYLVRAEAEPPDSQRAFEVARTLALADVRARGVAGLAQYEKAFHLTDDPETRAELAIELAMAMPEPTVIEDD